MELTKTVTVSMTLDRFEGEYAVLLYGDEDRAVNWPQQLLPEGTAEGDILSMKIAKDEQATAEALAATEKLLKELLSTQD